MKKILNFLKKLFFRKKEKSNQINNSVIPTNEKEETEEDDDDYIISVFSGKPIYVSKEKIKRFNSRSNVQFNRKAVD